MSADLKQFLRFLVSGVLAASVLLAVLYLLHGVWGFWYLGSSVGAFACAVLINFVLQGRWAFGAGSEGGGRRELTAFILVNLALLCSNVLLMSVLVEFIGLYYLFSQALVQGVLAGCSYFAYREIFTSSRLGRVIPTGKVFP